MEIRRNNEIRASIHKKIIKLALPAILENVMHTIVWTVDTAMVGRLSAEALSAVGFGSQLAFFLVDIFAAIGIGTSAIVARYIGAGNSKRANRVVAQSFLISLLCSLLLLALNLIFLRKLFFLIMKDETVIELGIDYVTIVSFGIALLIPTIVMNAALRGAGNTRLPMISAVVANSVNIIGDYVLIFGHFGFPRLEVQGAALATAIAQIVGAGITFSYLMSGKDVIMLKLKDFFRADFKVIKQIAKISIPSCIEEFSHCGSRLLSSVWIAQLGTVAFAAHQVAVSAESISFMPGYGFFVAASVLAGQYLGAGRSEDGEKCARVAAKMALVLMSGFGIFFLVCSKPIIGLFTNVREVERAATAAIRIGAFEQPSLAVKFALGGALKGAGDTRGTFKIGFIGTWFVRMPLMFLVIFITGKSLIFVWMVTVLQFTVEAILVYLRFKRGIWKKIEV